ncbi:MAG: hypothetical protein B6U87_00505 [Candidatus Aenigmarchaeota archaeon ex4484_52]|nr:MAG: hypothetical protein B6U87_00505 [Candidatus Aenigmarchaeota archaeon ex4484_52]
MEKTITIPLKDVYNKSSYTKRAKKCIFLVKKFLKKHTKTNEKNIKIGVQLNEFIWKNGMKNTPRKIDINISKKDKFLIANLPGIAIEEKEAIKTEETIGKKIQTKTEEKKEEKTISDDKPNL